MEFIPKQTYPNRTGVHPNSAFGLVYALDYARAVNDTAFEHSIIAQAKRLYMNDKNVPASWEPDGADFSVTCTGRSGPDAKVLPRAGLPEMVQLFITPAGIKHLTNLPVVSDRTDYQIVHLDGLCFSRSWCMKGLANTLPATHPARKLLMRASVKHLSEALPHVLSGNYGGEHWLASFVVYALMD